MSRIDITIKIAGEAGQGLQTIGQLLSKAFADDKQDRFQITLCDIGSSVRTVPAQK